MKEVKADSGLVVFHPFRINKDTREWEYSPHFHVLGFGWVTAVTQAYTKHGWVIKNKGVRKSVLGTIYYQLTHCGIKKKYHALTYFGACSYSKLKLKPEELESRNCPIWYGKYNLRSKDLELEEWVDDILEDLDSFGQYISDYRDPEMVDIARPENDPLNKADIGRWENNHWPDIQDRTDWIIEKLRSD